jgi:hypothetical protein
MQDTILVLNMKNKFSIDFIGVGAEKAATTWLADCLREHPEIFVPKQKELFFFNEYDPHFLEVKNYKYSKGLGWYEKYFQNADEENLKGEVSPTYLYCKKAAKRIKKNFPNAKILIILRDPVERAYSQYIHDLRLGLLDGMSFNEAITKHRSYKIKSTYSDHVKNYFDIFSKKNVLVLVLDDIEKNPSEEIKIVYRFLGVNGVNFKPPSLHKKPNKAGKARIFWLNSLMINTEYFIRRKKLNRIHSILEMLGIRRLALAIRDINSLKSNSYPKLNKLIENSLRKYFREDVEKTERLVEKNLNAWK